MATIMKKKADAIIRHGMMMASDMLKMSTSHLSMDYDQEADVLYLSFRRPQNATKTIEVGEDVLIRQDGDKIVGMTIMNASRR